MRPRERVLAAGVLAALALCGCIGHLSRGLDEDVAPSRAQAWVPPPQAIPQAPPPWAPAPALTAGRAVGLAELLAYALAHNPATAQAYREARAAAAAVGSARSAYYPTIDLSGDLAYSRQAAGGGRLELTSASYGPSATLTWLLLDLGGRSGRIDQAVQTLYAANFAQDATVQNTLFQVEQAYYQFLGAKGLVQAAQANLKDAEQNLAASEARRKAGVATLADVLQARTAVAQAELNLQTAQGQAASFRGTLAASVGLKASAPLVVGELPEKLNLSAVREDVDALIARAEENRPDLRQAQAQAQAAQGEVAVVRARLLPSLAVDANLGRSYFINGAAPFGNAVGASLVLRVPLFSGFGRAYDLIQAEELQKASSEHAKVVAQNVALEVWNSYQAVKTQAQRVETARALLASAQQSQDVVTGRYRAGVGSILDVLQAQSALAAARAQEVSARADWLVALAALARDTGVLGQEPPAREPSEGKGQ